MYWNTILMTSFEIYCYSLDTSFEIIILHCAEGASFSATPGFQELVYVCPSFTDFSDFHGAHSRRLHPVFPLLAFQLGFSGIPEIHEKTAKSYQWDWSSRTPFLDSFLSLFSGKVPFFPRGLRPLFSSLRRNPARRVNLVEKRRSL